MTEPSVPNALLDNDEQSLSPVAWEVPETIVAAVLATVTVLVVGGLATGIARVASVSASSFPPGLNSQEIWNAIQFGSLWAGPVVTVIALGALGLCWWQTQAWAEAAEARDPVGDVSEAEGHILRARLLARWAIVTLVVTAAGSVAYFVAEVGLNSGGQVWPLDINAGASLLAVLVLLGGGVLVGRQLRTDR
jgi:hypothetical protein